MEARRITKKDIRFGRRLKRLRNIADLTQEELSVKTGLSLTFIGLLESGQRRPSIKTLQKLASALRVKASDILPY